MGQRGAQNIDSLGITSDALAVYRVMLQERKWGLTEIATHLALTADQVRDSLDELAEHRLLREASPGVDLDPVRPAVGLSGLLARAEAEMRRRREALDQAAATVAAIVAEHDASVDRDTITRLEGVDAVRERLAELAAEVRGECLSLNPNAAQTPAAKAASRQLNQGLRARGVAIRCVYQDSFRNQPSIVSYARWLTEVGGQARTIPSVPVMMVIFDRHTALLPLDPNDSSKGALDIRTPGVVATACALFDHLWLTGTPFGQPAEEGEVDLDPVQRELLELLSAGHTDEMAARKLGISLTTVRRIMATIMERLGARSRFQAGVRARERGWLRT
ncbi:helix-turn-helix transcriptional regulator [Micromonospora ureilytica]|uniref:DNA-binding CsgD family transcriptional regulator n=1 Tax=Micromonospora ureilytica TaxID=709868 RepID=A0ABS0JHY1_9ACTN|nr:helix-turn-helix transcriptional regulator [Micromonospora ureilytica]MBG6066673.1 DNA-binding CsgD family transcriptional regulator [Micromonospora ureilytica]